VAKIGKNGPKMEFFDFFEISYFFNVIVLKREKTIFYFENRLILVYFSPF
jgi:hypothetical protein